MTRGKQTCKILKEIRQQIADKNEIEYVTSECHFQCECQGTCPKCEEEVRYLENELNRRRQLGKAVAVAGISLGIASTFSACNSPQQQMVKETDAPISEQKIATEVILDAKPISDTDIEMITLPITPTKKLSRKTEPVIIDTISIRQKYPDINYSPYMLSGLYIESVEPTYFAEEMCEFPGGMDSLYKYLKEKLIYPASLKKNKIKGTIRIDFIVTMMGKVSDVKVTAPLHSDLDKEVVRVFQEMPLWKPAKNKGYNIHAYYNLSIRFPLKKQLHISHQKPTP